MSALKSKDARLKLHRKMVKAGTAKEIKWESVGTGRAIGYRRLEGSPAGKFYTRLFDKNRPGSNKYHKQSLGSADDVAPANGTDILNFAQAVKLVSCFDPWASPDNGDKVGTVADAANLYLQWTESNRPKTHRVIKSNFNCHVFGDEIASIPVERLTVQHLERWKTRVAAKPRGHVNGPLEAPANADELQSRKANANRPIAWLKRSLRYCKEIGAITCDDTAWQMLKKFKGVERAGRRGQPPYLTGEQVASLFEAIEDECFLHLVQAAVWTGARYSELASMVVADLEGDTVTVRDGKGGKKRNIFLGDNGTHLFTLVCEGRKTDERIFLKANGSVWGNNHAQRPLQRAQEAAGLPHFSFHVLRHTYCSLTLMAGGNEFDLMKQLGHSTTQQISANYGHLANQHRQEQAKRCEPRIPTTSPTTREATLH